MRCLQFQTLFLFLFVPFLGFAQPFQIGHTTVNFVDASRNNRVIATEIYYPAENAGENVALTTSTTAQFPVLSFGHGFVMSWEAYQNYWDFLVPNGYIMAFPKTEGSLSPSHLDFGRDLSFVINQMLILGNTSSSIFFNKVSPMNAVMGHSMGGGASFLAAQQNTNIKTLVNFAPAETNPSAINAASVISIPALIFTGVNDCVTPASTNQIPMFNNLISNCKTLINIIGGSHCQMANNNFFCSFGESTCSPQATISRPTQQNVINSYLLPWLDFQLKGNCNQGNAFDTLLSNDPTITSQKNCVQCSNLTVNNPTQLNEITIFPNPIKDFVTISGKTGEKYAISVYDITAKVVIYQKFINEITLETTSLSKGFFTYTIENEDGILYNGKIIK